MKLPEIFFLTKREQRLVIGIVIALLVGTVVKRYYDDRSDLPPAKSSPAIQSETSPASLPAEERAAPDE